MRTRLPMPPTSSVNARQIRRVGRAVYRAAVLTRIPVKAGTEVRILYPPLL